jgi:hypothetical protein
VTAVISRSKPQPAAPACDCTERLAQLEETVAALARAAARAGHAREVLDTPRGAIANHSDAALIRAAATPAAKDPA